MREAFHVKCGDLHEKITYYCVITIASLHGNLKYQCGCGLHEIGESWFSIKGVWMCS